MNDRTRADDHVSLDAVLDVLSNERRRLVLEYLLQDYDSATVEELIDHVVTEIRPLDDARPDELRSQVEVKLTHVHLPKTDDAGIIEYDRDRRIVSVTDATPVVQPYLELFRTDDP